MSDYLFNYWDFVTYDNRGGARSRGKIIHRFFHKDLKCNVYYIELDNPVFPVIMLEEEKLELWV